MGGLCDGIAGAWKGIESCCCEELVEVTGARQMRRRSFRQESPVIRNTNEDGASERVK